MTQTITDAFHLPRPEDIRAMGFVVRLREADPGSDEVRKLVDDYVVTPAVAAGLPRILDDMKQVYDRRQEYGRFIHGSFGSGKSHFMTMLALLLEGEPHAWDRFSPAPATGATATRVDPAHRAWLADARLLVVRIHMLSIRGKTTSFDRAVYEGFNQALKRRGKAPFEFLHLDGLFDEVRREAAEYGDIVWKRLEADGIVGGREDFEQIAAGTPQARERFAKAWLAKKGRTAADAGIDPRWSEGLLGMAAHAKAQGFGGIVLMIDEFLLWLAEKSGSEFVSEVHNLRLVVDHDRGERAVPMFVFVARQRNLQEFYPDLVDETKIHEHIDHQLKRFETTKLQDVELRHIVRGRVLRPRDPAAVAAAVQTLAERHTKVLPALLANADIDYLRDVYPFHPALIEMLVDVTSLMQRERSALRLLYELLVVHYPNLPLGEFLPVGSAFDAIFPESGVEASKKVELMQDIHHQYWSRLAPAIRRMAEAQGVAFTEERRKALDQLVKTVLLAEVSPRLKQGGLTIERLVQLNAVDVEGETFRGQVRVAETDLLALSSTYVPDLQIAGSGKTGIVRYVLGRVSLGEYLARARSKVDNATQRFKVFWAALKSALGLTAVKGFEEGGPNTGDWDLTWRRTKRRGAIKLGNVREMAYDDFVPPDGGFRVLIDYPWDEPGHTVDEDRLRAINVRKNKGLLYSVCWLPRHMSPTEFGLLTELAAVRFLLSDAGQADLLEAVGPQDRSKLLDQAGVRCRALEGQLAELLVELYVRHGEFCALISDVDGGRPRETLAENLEHIATLLMDRQFPQHPSFLAEPKRAELEVLLKWMVAASDQHQSVPYDEATGKVLRTLGQPLELVNLGQTKATLRLDSRYIKDVLQKTDQDVVSWTLVADHLRQTYGFQPLVIDLFLAFLCQRDHRAINELDGERVDVRLGMPATARLRLQRGQLVSAADWHRLRDLGDQLFREPRPPSHRSLQGQDRFAAACRERGQARRAVLQGAHQRLVQLMRDPDAAEGAVPAARRLQELAEANARLAPLVSASTDSFEGLSAWLAAWPEPPEGGVDPLCAVVQQAEALRETLGEIDDAQRVTLQNGVHHPELGVEVHAHLDRLQQRLAAGHTEQPLTPDWVRSWNRAARDLVNRLVSQPRPQPRDPEPDPPRPPGQRPNPPRDEQLLLEATVDPADPDAVSQLLAEVRRVLSDRPPGSLRVALVRRGDTT